jgi:hypothetical protein
VSGETCQNFRNGKFNTQVQCEEKRLQNFQEITILDRKEMLRMHYDTLWKRTLGYHQKFSTILNKVQYNTRAIQKVISVYSGK